MNLSPEIEDAFLFAFLAQNFPYLHNNTNNSMEQKLSRSVSKAKAQILGQHDDYKRGRKKNKTSSRNRKLSYFEKWSC